jgi:hypothetical protein
MAWGACGMMALQIAVESLFSRLSSPVPVTKLLVANHLATVLTGQNTRAVAQEALIRGLREARFESEVTELLAVPLMSGDFSLDIDALRTAIEFPSVLSDSILSLIGGRDFLVKAWMTAHSGPAPQFYSPKSLEILRKAQIIPPFVGYRLAGLEQDSGLPLLRQWCFEFDSLVQRSEEEGSSHFSHFSSGDREHKVGQFVSIDSHRARSAYLRSLAIACERWGMPVEIAEDFAAAVRPIDPKLRAFVPTKAPDWTSRLVPDENMGDAEWAENISSVIGGRSGDSEGIILHADFLVAERKHWAAELELVTVLSDRSDVKAEEVFSRHHELPGHWSYKAADAFTFQAAAEGLPGGRFVPAAIPISDDYLGLFYCELMSRLPYLPRRFGKTGELRTRSSSSQIEVLSGSETIGKVVYWNRDWSPTHLRHLKPNCGVATIASAQFVTEMEEYSRKKLLTFWRLKRIERQKDYGPWDTKESLGEVI